MKTLTFEIANEHAKKNIIMITKKEIQKVVNEIKSLCKSNQFKEAGELSRENKLKFIAMIKCGGSDSLSYAYKICSYFNMRQTDCFNLIF